jgi:hypothetical protein
LFGFLEVEISEKPFSIEHVLFCLTSAAICHNWDHKNLIARASQVFIIL